MTGSPPGDHVAARLARVTDWLDHGGFLVTGIAVVHCAATGALLGFEVGGSLLVLAASGTFLVYWFDRVFSMPPEDRVNRPDRVRWIDEHPEYRLAAPVVAAVVAVLSAAMLPADVLLVAAAIGLLGGMHGMPFLRGHRLKDFPFLKPALVATGWGAGAVALPIVEAGLHPFSGEMVLLGVGRALFVFANVLLCDLYDRPGDTVALDWPEDQVRRVAAGVAVAAGSVVAASAAITPLDFLWLFDAGGPVLLAAAALGGTVWPALNRPIVLDLVVAWPALTILLAAV